MNPKYRPTPQDSPSSISRTIWGVSDAWDSSPRSTRRSIRSCVSTPYTAPSRRPRRPSTPLSPPKARADPCVTINAGYWWAGNSLSLLITDGVVKSIENQTVERNGQTVYPLRAAFGQMNDGSLQSRWIYCLPSLDDKPYAFPSALDNDERTHTYMSAPPTSNYPGAEPWTPREAVGGGPMLVYEGKNVAVENYWKEVFDGGGIAGTSRQPRTAIGATADGKIILLVCDGRNMRGSAGFTLSELADKLIALGAVKAVNLDGGGSSTMVGIEGTVLNRPSDTGSKENIVQRSISTAVVISETN